MDDEPSPWADAPSSPPPRTLSPSSIRKSLEAPLPTLAPPSPTPQDADDSFDSFDDPPPARTTELDGGDDAAFGQQPTEDDGFDDFDDPAPVGTSGADDGFGGDDDFGDFGDFEEDGGAAGGDMGFGEEEEGRGELDLQGSSPLPPPPPYASLALSPFPDAQTLASSVQAMLAPIFPNLDPHSQMGPEDVRQVPGLGQVLVDEESRKLYKSLTSVPPLARLDWTRSRVRREHLINLGVPVNLDEVASTKPPSLPTLRISTLVAQNPSQPSPAPRPTSTPPAPRPNAPKRSNTITGSSSSTTRRVIPVSLSASGTNTPGGSARSAGPRGNVEVGGNGRDRTYGLGKRPEVDWKKVQEVTEVASDALPLMGLPELSLLHAQLEDATASASVLLSYLLQLKDAQQHVSLISNGLIGELVQQQMRAAMSGQGKGNR